MPFGRNTFSVIGKGAEKTEKTGRTPMALTYAVSSARPRMTESVTSPSPPARGEGRGEGAACFPAGITLSLTLSLQGEVIGVFPASSLLCVRSPSHAKEALDKFRGSVVHGRAAIFSARKAL